MEKRNLRITGFEDNVGASGKAYTRFKTVSMDGTQEIWMSVFDTKIIENMKFASTNGKAVCVSVAITKRDDKEFKNIRAYHGLAEENFDVDEKPMPIAPTPTLVDKHTTMYVSYAKDVFIAMFCQEDWSMSAKETMNEAVKLVKQAKTEFEAIPK